MAKIGNETKLVLKLAKERARRSSARGVEPNGFEEDPKLHEAYTMGFGAGQKDYESNLTLIVIELEEGR